VEDNNKNNSLRSKYERLESDRYVFLQRARQCSELTLPTLVPPLGHNKTTKYYTPWQGIGARGVNNLAAKILLALLPPNAPFFKLSLDDFTIGKLSHGKPEGRAKIDEALNKVERAVQNEVEISGLRAPIFLALKHLIVAGNVLLYLPKEGGMRVFCIDSYVCIRDPKGNLLEVIIKETVSPDALEKDIYDLMYDANEDGITVTQARQREKSEDNDKKGEKDNKTELIDIFTRFYRDDNKWHMYQEVFDKEVPDSEGQWPADKPPFLALRWSTVENEDYGRSYVEEYLGDLISLEGLSKAVVEAAAATAKIIWLVNPNGLTIAKDITEAESGDAVDGVETDVHCLQAEKQADMRIASETIKTISDRLAYAFLMSSAIQRNGERVTAEEIRYMAGELESALGGVYSVLSQEFQLPLVKRLMDRMQKQKRLPELPDEVLTPAITTGVEALGRGQDLNKYVQFMQFFQQTPEALQYINVSDLITRIGTSLMIDMTGLVKTADEVAQEKQAAMQQNNQQQMADIAGKAAPAAIKAVSDHMANANAAAPTK
jgi:hypothetical protein